MFLSIGKRLTGYKLELFMVVPGTALLRHRNISRPLSKIFVAEQAAPGLLFCLPVYQHGYREYSVWIEV